MGCFDVCPHPQPLSRRAGRGEVWHWHRGQLAARSSGVSSSPPDDRAWDVVPGVPHAPRSEWRPTRVATGRARPHWGSEAPGTRPQPGRPHVRCRVRVVWHVPRRRPRRRDVVRCSRSQERRVLWGVGGGTSTHPDAARAAPPKAPLRPTSRERASRERRVRCGDDRSLESVARHECRTAGLKSLLRVPTAGCWDLSEQPPLPARRERGSGVRDFRSGHICFLLGCHYQTRKQGSSQR
jgi:hypothetical protein